MIVNFVIDMHDNGFNCSLNFQVHVHVTRHTTCMQFSFVFCYNSSYCSSYLNLRRHPRDEWKKV